MLYARRYDNRRYYLPISTAGPRKGDLARKRIGGFRKRGPRVKYGPPRLRDSRAGHRESPLGCHVRYVARVWSSCALTPGLNRATASAVHKDSDVRPCTSITPSDAHSGCITMRPLHRCSLWTAAGEGGPGIPKIFTSSPDGQEANEKWPSIDVRARDTEKFIRVARKIYKNGIPPVVKCDPERCSSSNGVG